MTRQKMLILLPTMIIHQAIFSGVWAIHTMVEEIRPLLIGQNQPIDAIRRDALIIIESIEDDAGLFSKGGTCYGTISYVG